MGDFFPIARKAARNDLFVVLKMTGSKPWGVVQKSPRLHGKRLKRFR
jgi:hypothetical protein